MHMHIITREASQTDVPAIAELFDLYRQFYEQEPNQPLALAFITERLAKQESVILVAESDPSGLVGFCQLYEPPRFLRRLLRLRMEPS
jgi:hypothetical protein